ncbi:MAG: diguanylate cyclase [Abitibacteriaceae bacterium]|nr:diguanylate cyclase [Abditibacteriaceae bacterium]
MRSLRLKFTLTLVVTSLTAITLVGMISRGMMLRKFNHLLMENSFQQFRTSVKDYLTTYGSWEKAQQAEPFDQYERRWRTSHQAQARSGNLTTGTMPAPVGVNSGSPPADAVPPPQDAGSPDEAGPPDGAGPPEDAGPPGAGPPQEDDSLPGAGPGAAPRSGPGDGAQVPFLFLLLDPQGKVLMGPPELRGHVALPNQRAGAEPIVVKGQVVALAVPFGQPNYSRQDREYLGALQQALFYGVVGAGALILILSIVFGNYLSRTLRELTTAIQAMGQGQLRQQVRVQSHDEIGVLAGAFNRMSADLAQAHEELQQSNKKISEQALLLKEISIRDELTKLYNRRHFNEQFATAFAQAERYNQPLTVMIGDIDYFKRINDTFSHAGGDRVLQCVSRILQMYTRDSDIVARYGGEEFVVAFTHTGLHQAVVLCERLRQQIEAYPWHEIHPEMHVTMSMGLTDNVRLGSFESMIAGADKQLYQAKAEGRNRVCADELS